MSLVAFLKLAHKFLICLHGSWRGGKILESCRKRVFPTAVGSAEEDIEVRARTLGQLFVRPAIGRAAAMKVDVRGDNGLGDTARGVLIGLSRPVWRLEISFKLMLQPRRIFLINRSGVSRRADRQAAKILNDFLLVPPKALAIEKVVVVEQIHYLSQIFTEEEVAEPSGIGFLNIYQRVLTVEVGQDKVNDGRYNQGVGEMLGVPEVDGGFPFLLNWKHANRPGAG